MPETEILVIARCVERLLIVVICGASLGFGWNLFRVGILNDQQAELASKNWKLALKHVGPGVFFALFAVVGLVYAIRAPLTLGPGNSVDNHAGPLTQQNGPTINYESGADDKSAREEITAINTVVALWEADAPRNISDVDKRAGIAALSTLQHRREELLQGTYAHRYEQYKALRIKVTSHPDALNDLSDQEREDYDYLDRVSGANLMTSTTLQLAKP